MDVLFMFFSTVFQSYLDNEFVIMEGCVQWKSVSYLGPLDQQASIQPSNQATNILVFVYFLYF